MNEQRCAVSSVLLGGRLLPAEVFSSFRREYASPDPLFIEESPHDLPVLSDVTKHSWHSVLSGCRGDQLLYVQNADELSAFFSFMEEQTEPVTLLSEFDLDDDTVLPDHVTTVPFNFSINYLYFNDFLEFNYPLIFHYCNTFDLLLRILCPCRVVAPVSDRFQIRLLADLCRADKIDFVQR